MNFKVFISSFLLLIMSAGLCALGVWQWAELYPPKETRQVRGEIALVNLNTPSLRKGWRRGLYVQLRGSDVHYHLPRLLLTTPSENELRAAKHAEIQYDVRPHNARYIGLSTSLRHKARRSDGGAIHVEFTKDPGITYYNVTSIALDGAPYLTSLSYHLELGLRGLLLILCGGGVFISEILRIRTQRSTRR